MKDRLVGYAKGVAKQFQDDDVPGIGAELAYRFLFAVFPFGIFLAALGAFVAQWVGIENPTEKLMSAIGDNLPSELASTIQPQIEAVIGKTNPGLLTFGAVAALWSATGGMSSLMKAMNRAYDVEESRPFLAKTARALILTILGGAGILLSFVTIVGGSTVTQQVGEQLGFGQVAWTAIELARWPLVLALLAVAVGVLFHFGPNAKVSWKYTILGGFVFAIFWLVATGVFALYVANFSNYANTYGALGGVIVLMLWFYITGIVLVTSAEIVAVLAKTHEPHILEQRRNETQVEKAGREVQAKAERGAKRAKEAAEGALATARDKVDERGGAGGGPAKGRLGGAGFGTDRRSKAHRDRPQVIPGSMAWSDDGGRDRANPLFAALVVGGGALVGAIVGRLTGRGAEDEA